jgi:transposase
LRVRQEKAKPLLDSLEVWLRTKLQTLSRKSETAKAINYCLNQWDALSLYCSDGMVEIDNNVAENALRCVVMGRSLCTSFRNLDKHWDLSFDIVATRAMFAC